MDATARIHVASSASSSYAKIASITDGTSNTIAMSEHTTPTGPSAKGRAATVGGGKTDTPAGLQDAFCQWRLQLSPSTQTLVPVADDESDGAALFTSLLIP